MKSSFIYCARKQHVGDNYSVVAGRKRNYCSFHINVSMAFWRLLFYCFLFLAETFMMCVNVFYITRNVISAWSD